MTTRYKKGGKGLNGVSIGVKEVSTDGVVVSTNAQIGGKKVFPCAPQGLDTVYQTDAWKEGDITRTLYIDDSGRAYVRNTHPQHRPQWYRVPELDV
jgi:hypothetical protein